MHGKLIVLDGLDGSGKSTQTKLLVQRLRDEGYAVESIDFPQYGSWSAAFVEQYLRGNFGSAEKITPYQASLFYALDRFAAKEKIQQWLRQGKVVISNRYVSANKGHQLGKIASPEEKRHFLAWLNGLEYGLLGIPKPSRTLFLHMTPEIGQTLVDAKGARSYTTEKRDIHEKDITHLRNAEQAYLFCLENDPIENWQRIICFKNNRPRTREEIHEEVYAAVQKVLQEEDKGTERG